MKKIILKQVLLILISICFITQSCNEDENKNIVNDLIISDQSEGIIQLGEKLENPYSVENMKIALDNIKSNTKKNSNVSIQPTHLYVRFLPKSELELDSLEEDTTLYLFDYPLDYKIKNKGTYYHDPSIPEGNITWQYTVVPINYIFPNIEYEIISNLFLSFDNQQGLKSGSINEITWPELEKEALLITNNLNKSYFSSKLKSSWYPSGTIRVWDDIANRYIPVVGAKVRAVNWFKVKESYTNSNGFFQTESFNNAVDYTIKWERTDYDIREGAWGQAYYQGPNESTSAWNLDIGSATSTTKSMRYATIHRAAYRYHYGNINGMKRPKVWVSLKYCYYDKAGTGVNWGNWDPTGLFPDILIYGKNSSGNYHSTDVIYSTSIHETGHASHIELMNAGEIQFGQVSWILIESWANAVEWYISKIEYTELGITNYDNPNTWPYSRFGDNMQWWKSSNDHIYTPLFIDLVDNFNQSYSTNVGAVMPSNRCPNGGTYNSVGCKISSFPQGESWFIYNNSFYYTPVGCCSCPTSGTWYDGANCFVINIPSTVIPFVYYFDYYFTPAGDSRFPNDHVSSYTLPFIESNILKHSYGLSSLLSNLKANKPTNITDRHLDILFNFYFNL